LTVTHGICRKCMRAIRRDAKAYYRARHMPLWKNALYNIAGVVVLAILVLAATLIVAMLVPME
jgi:hypothetical protein